MIQTVTDQMQRKVEIMFPPRRIISLVPSQTELLYDLGLEEEIIGITSFCVHPQFWQRTKTRVGGTKQLHLEKIRQLEPDLILGNKEENDRTQLETLMKEFPVWMSDIYGIKLAQEMIEMVGELTGKPERAAQISHQIKSLFPEPTLKKGDSAAYLIWRKPWMVAGGDTFINEMLGFCGFQNVLAGRMRYPEIQLRELADLGVVWVLLSSEPYPFKEKHLEEVRQLIPGARIILVDGEMFSWYGSRMLKAAGYFKELRHKFGIGET